MYSELCISTDSRVSHIQWGHVSLIDRLHSCTGQSTVIISRLPTFPPHTLLIQPHTFPQPSSFCASYLFILFSASILLPLAQVSTPWLSCRLMIRALLCLSLFFPPLVTPYFYFPKAHLCKFFLRCPFQTQLNQYSTLREHKENVHQWAETQTHRKQQL